MGDRIDDRKLECIGHKDYLQRKRKEMWMLNCRGIFLSSMICKVYEKFIYLKLEPIIEERMTEFQAGARKGRRTSDQIIILKTKIEYDNLLNQDTYIQFYYICKCLDKLYLRDAMNDLGNNGRTDKLYRIIYLLNCNTKT